MRRTLHDARSTRQSPRISAILNQPWLPTANGGDGGGGGKRLASIKSDRIFEVGAHSRWRHTVHTVYFRTCTSGGVSRTRGMIDRREGKGGNDLGGVLVVAYIAKINCRGTLFARPSYKLASETTTTVTVTAVRRRRPTPRRARIDSLRAREADKRPVTALLVPFIRFRECSLSWRTCSLVKIGPGDPAKGARRARASRGWARIKAKRTIREINGRQNWTSMLEYWSRSDAKSTGLAISEAEAPDSNMDERLSSTRSSVGDDRWEIILELEIILYRLDEIIERLTFSMLLIARHTRWWGRVSNTLSRLSSLGYSKGKRPSWLTRFHSSAQTSDPLPSRTKPLVYASRIPTLGRALFMSRRSSATSRRHCSGSPHSPCRRDVTMALRDVWHTGWSRTINCRHYVAFVSSLDSRERVPSFFPLCLSFFSVSPAEGQVRQGERTAVAEGVFPVAVLANGRSSAAVRPSSRRRPATPARMTHCHRRRFASSSPWPTDSGWDEGAPTSDSIAARTELIWWEEQRRWWRRRRRRRRRSGIGRRDGDGVRRVSARAPRARFPKRHDDMKWLST